jgi:hypothetical protein
MKKLNLLFAFCILLLNFAQAQAPNQFNYSGVARNAANQPVANGQLGIKISILQGSPTGNALYVETQNITTNTNGIFNLQIGTGSVISGSMGMINWSYGPYFIKVEMDVTGNTNYTIVGITQLISVPYAMHAQTAGSLIGGGSSGSFNHFIGEAFGGGVIFHLWKDAQGVEHGLVVATTDQSTSQAWSNITNLLIGQTAQNSWDGLSNSNAIVAQSGHTNSAARLCLDLVRGGFSDWYLPSIQELSMLWNNSFTVVKSLSQISGASQLASADYWSSSEFSQSYSNVYGNNAWWISFESGRDSFDGGKGNTNYVRAIRAF